jgi:DMSO reductase anchor subunit
LILGFVIPFGLIALRNESFSWVLLLSVILGEIIDRLIFYREFKPERPFESYLADVR